MKSDIPPARERILAAAMDLFGRQGFKATTITQIEQAAGLSVGAGGMYRHFRSKRELLEAGLAEQAERSRALVDFIADPAALANLPLHERLFAVARAGLRRLDEERDVNRMLVRDLADFPDLLEKFREHELKRIAAALTAWLRSEAPDTDADVEALAAVFIESVSHYWLLRDAYGEHPLAVDEARYLGALADMAAAVITPQGSRSGAPRPAG